MASESFQDALFEDFMDLHEDAPARQGRTFASLEAENALSFELNEIPREYIDLSELRKPKLPKKPKITLDKRDNVA